MKKVATFAAIAAASQVNAFDAEFMRGAQTGMFLNSEEQFEDYSCEPVQIDPKIKTYIEMAGPMKMMMANMNKGEPNPMLDTALDAVQAYGKISSLFSLEYDGGEFCKGLLFSKEASRIVFKLGGAMMNKKQEEAEAEPAGVAKQLNGKSTHFKSRY